MKANNIAAALEPSIRLDLDCRICKTYSRTTKNAAPYRVLNLQDETGVITAYMWPDKYRGSYIPTGHDDVHVVAKTRISPALDVIVLDIVDMVPVPKPPTAPIEQTVLELCSIPEDGNALLQMINRLQSQSLKMFMAEVLSDNSNVKTYLDGQADYIGHHAYKGGLLRHSLECARIIEKNFEDDPVCRDIGIVAALLHDFGKVRAGYNLPKAKYPPAIPHDALTLMFLAKPLENLRQAWLDGETLLEHILTYPLTKDKTVGKNCNYP